MIRTSVIPCLSSGLAKNNKIMSMFVLFFQLYWPFRKSFTFFENRGTMQSDMMFCQFFKVTTVK